MAVNRNIGDVEYMKKRRIPKKYQHVKARLDTGCSLTKYLERLEEIKRNYRYRKGEIFKRLKVTTFAQLVLKITFVSDLNESENDCELQNPEGKSIQHNEPADMPYPDCPYLLLDVRDREQYKLCHIISAQSFPSSLLYRTMTPYSKEVLEYKNTAGKIIIVYDEDERTASLAATTMCERGFENLFMLSGGLKVATQKFPEGLTTGSIPTSFLSSPTSSNAKTGSVQQGQLQAEKRWRFTSGELEKIHEHLDKILTPSNTNKTAAPSLRAPALGVDRVLLQLGETATGVRAVDPGNNTAPLTTNSTNQ